jgi:hypothetical protein
MCSISLMCPLIVNHSLIFFILSTLPNKKTALSKINATSILFQIITNNWTIRTAFVTTFRNIRDSISGIIRKGCL